MFFALIFSFLAEATVSANLRSLTVNVQSVNADSKLITDKATLPPIEFEWKKSVTNKVNFNCQTKPWRLQVQASQEEAVSTFYRGLRGLGFLFPHPRVQISPSLSALKSQCGKSFKWKPALRYRGLHLHTLHPNEWVRGFLMDRPDISLETVRWSARNTFNILDVSLLRLPLEDIKKKFSPALSLAKELGVHMGVSLGVALQQQKSYKLLTVWQAITGLGGDEALVTELNKLIDALDTSFIVLEAGTSEFTPTNADKTIQWLNQSAKIAQSKGKALLTKVHVSSNQHDDKYGNYNFLPSFANPDVGILPHTVMFYGLLDKKAPMYGNQNFFGIREFLLKEKEKRPTWYYPETGYWVAMDADIPLLLTDYLRTRAQDLEWLHSQNTDGQLVFSTGHGFGGWLYDWTQALLTDTELNFDPYAGLKLLGEDVNEWRKLFEFQQKEFKDNGIISMISAANLQDELSTTHRIHDRHTIKQLRFDSEARKIEIQLLRKAAATWPEVKIKDPELSRLVLITRLRLEQALQIREALDDENERAESLQNSRALRAQASMLLAQSRSDNRNYADLGVQDIWTNPTSYQFGYLYPSASLYWWKREERMVAEDSYWPFSENIYSIWNILF